MKNLLTVFLMLISSLLLSGCFGFSVFCVQNTVPGTTELEITTFKVHYTTQYGKLIKIYEYEKEESNENNNISESQA